MLNQVILKNTKKKTIIINFVVRTVMGVSFIVWYYISLLFFNLSDRTVIYTENWYVIEY